MVVLRCGVVFLLRITACVFGLVGTARAAVTHDATTIGTQLSCARTAALGAAPGASTVAALCALASWCWRLRLWRLLVTIDNVAVAVRYAVNVEAAAAAVDLLADR